jgi:deazaflavin-dependent oxidoreductase (nitroreductase family)
MVAGERLKGIVRRDSLEPRHVAGKEAPMPVDLTPHGTRGGTMPRIPKPIRKIVLPIANLFLKSRGMKILTLTTVGAKSGNEHEVPLTYFADPTKEGARLLVASAGGARKHPAWYINMAKNPDKIWMTLDGRKTRVTAESLSGPERDAAWARVVAEQSLYAGYEQKTDREIPVVRITPA